ncbi:MAG: hypothetical protein WDN31_06850 [Hyphomicrobium sp.]
MPKRGMTMGFEPDFLTGLGAIAKLAAPRLAALTAAHILSMLPSFQPGQSSS